MRTDINGVQAAFFGFNGHEEEIDEIKKAIGSRVGVFMNTLDAWQTIADVLEEAGISNVSFTVDQGICFVRVCNKMVFTKNIMTLKNRPLSRLGGKVTVSLYDNETGKEDTLMVGDIIGIESSAENTETLTVKRRDPVS